MSERVVAIRRQRAAQAPPPPTYATVTTEARSAADTLERRAAAIRRALGVNFATASSVAAIPNLIREAEAALAELKELTNV